MEIDIATAAAERLHKWVTMVLWTVGVAFAIVLTSLAIWGFTKVSDVRSVLNDFNTNVRPKVEQAKADAQSASDDATKAKKQIAATVKEANQQLAKVRDINGKVENLSKQVTSVQNQLLDLQKRLAIQQPPPPSQPSPNQRCRIHLSNVENGNFGDQTIGKEGRPLMFGVRCEGGGASTARIRLTGPFFFVHDEQETTINFGGMTQPFAVFFKPDKPGPANGLMTMSTPQSAARDIGLPPPYPLSGTAVPALPR